MILPSIANLIVAQPLLSERQCSRVSLVSAAPLVC